MSQHPHRPQATQPFDDSDEKPLVIKPLTNLDDRVNNPDDIEPDATAIANGPVHGGDQESHAQEHGARGEGGRKHRR